MDIIEATDVIQLVAEAKCPNCHECKPEVFNLPIGQVLVIPEPPCHGTGLRWPELSRASIRLASCQCGAAQDGRLSGSNWGHRSGCDLGQNIWDKTRASDVTLEKVILCLRVEAITNISFRVGVTENNILCTVETHPHPRVMRGGDTDLEAACAALLAT